MMSNNMPRCRTLALLSSCLILLSIASIYYMRTGGTFLRNINSSTWEESAFNTYRPDGNSSVLLALDSGLYGEGKVFENESIAINIFERWLNPFENLFNITFHVRNVTLYTPGSNDSLDSSMSKVPSDLSWNLATSVTDPDINGNGYDWLIIYQENYLGGRNRANAIGGNALIISHNQPLSWTSRQLILLHEVGHIFTGEHLADGVIPEEWYGDRGDQSIMSYDDLAELHRLGWDLNNMPIDEHNYRRINNTKYRFDLVDPDLDNLPNYYEHRFNLNPNVDDSSNDADNDGLANIEEYNIGTNPRDDDTDNDGYSDWAEHYSGSSPFDNLDIPVIETPIIIPWTTSSTIEEGEQLILQWRSISTNPAEYLILINGSQVLRQSWDYELIEYQLGENERPGVWNFTCVVIEADYDKNTASIFVTIISSHETAFNLPSLIFAIIFILIVLRKNKH